MKSFIRKLSFKKNKSPPDSGAANASATSSDKTAKNSAPQQQQQQQTGGKVVVPKKPTTDAAAPVAAPSATSPASSAKTSKEKSLQQPPEGKVTAPKKLTATSEAAATTTSPVSLAKLPKDKSLQQPSDGKTAVSKKLTASPEPSALTTASPASSAKSVKENSSQPPAEGKLVIPQKLTTKLDQPPSKSPTSSSRNVTAVEEPITRTKSPKPLLKQQQPNPNQAKSPSPQPPQQPPVSAQRPKEVSPEAASAMSLSSATSAPDVSKAEKKKPEVTHQEATFDGEALRIELKVLSSIQPSARWYFKAMSVQGKRYVQKIKQRDDHYAVVLIVEEASMKDSGTYKCKVGNGVGDATVTINVTPNELRVERKDIPPRFNRKLQPQDVPESETATYICTVSGTEPITFKWLLQGRELPLDDSNYEITRVGNKIKLVIKEVWASDNGEIECVAENPFGKASTVGRLHVQENIALRGLKKRMPAARPPTDDDDVLLLRAGKLKHRANQASKEEPTPVKLNASSYIKDRVRQASVGINMRRASMMTLKKLMPEVVETLTMAGGPNATKRPDTMEIPPNSPYFESVPDNQVINRGNDFNTEVAINIPDPSTMKFPTVKWFFGVPRRRGDVSTIKELKEENDKRFKISVDEANQTASLVIKRCDQKDEGHYGVCLMDANGDVLDRAGFSIFAKDPDQNFDFRNLLKRTHIDEEEESEEEVEWGTLKRTFVPTTKAKKIRRRHGDGSQECLEEEEYDEDTLGDLEPSFGRPRASTFSPIGSNRESREAREAQEKRALAEDLEMRLQASRAEKMGRRLSLMEAIPNFPVLRKAPKVVVEKGEFEEELEDCQAVQGETKEATFTCVFSDESFKPRWFKGRSEIFIGQKYMMESEGGKHTLTVKSPHSDDTGPYTCDCDGVTTTAMLMVEVRRTRISRELPPRSRISRKATTVLEVEMSDDKGDPQWFKNGKPITPKRGKIEIKKDGNKCQLIIYNGSPDDEGKYSCKVEDSTSETDMTFEEGDWKFIEKLENASTTEDQPVTFAVTVNEPNADVTWFANGEEVLPDDRRFEIGQNGMKRTLTVKKPKRGDNGLKIACKTTKDQTEASLQVKVGKKLTFKDLATPLFKGSGGGGVGSKGLFQLESACQSYTSAQHYTSITSTTLSGSDFNSSTTTTERAITSSSSGSTSASAVVAEGYSSWLSSLGMSSALSSFINRMQVDNYEEDHVHVASLTARPHSPSEISSSADGYLTPMEIDDVVTSSEDNTDCYGTPMGGSGSPQEMEHLSLEEDDENRTVCGDDPSPLYIGALSITNDASAFHQQLQIAVSCDPSSVFSNPPSPNTQAINELLAENSGSLLRPLKMPKPLKAASLDTAEDSFLEATTPTTDQFGLLRPSQRSHSSSGSPSGLASPGKIVPAGLTEDPDTLVQGLSKIKALHEESKELAARLHRRYHERRLRSPQLLLHPPALQLQQVRSLTPDPVTATATDAVPTAVEKPPLVRPRSFDMGMISPQVLLAPPPVPLSTSPRLRPNAPIEFQERMMRLRQEAVELAERLHNRHSRSSASSAGPLSPSTITAIPHIDADSLLTKDDDMAERISIERSLTPKQVSFDLPDPVEEVEEEFYRDEEHTQGSLDVPESSGDAEAAPKVLSPRSKSLKDKIEHKYQKLLNKFGLQTSKQKKAAKLASRKSVSEDNLSLSNIQELKERQQIPPPLSPQPIRHQSTPEPTIIEEEEPKKPERKLSWRKKLFRKTSSLDSKTETSSKEKRTLVEEAVSEPVFDEAETAAHSGGIKPLPQALVVIAPSDPRSPPSLSSGSCSSIQQMAQRLLQPIEEVAEQNSLEHLHRKMLMSEAGDSSYKEEQSLVVDVLSQRSEDTGPRMRETLTLMVEHDQVAYEPGVTAKISSIQSPSREESSSVSLAPSRVIQWLGAQQTETQSQVAPSSETASTLNLDSEDEREYLAFEQQMAMEEAAMEESLLVASKQAEVDWKFQRISRRYRPSSGASSSEEGVSTSAQQDVDSKYQKILERYALKRQVSDVTAEVASADKIPPTQAKKSWDRKAQFSLDEQHSSLSFEQQHQNSKTSPVQQRPLMLIKQPQEGLLEPGYITDSVFTPSSEDSSAQQANLDDKSLAQATEVAQNYLTAKSDDAAEVSNMAAENSLTVPTETSTHVQLCYHAVEANAEQVEFNAHEAVEIRTFDTEVDFANPTFRDLPEWQLVGGEYVLVEQIPDEFIIPQSVAPAVQARFNSNLSKAVSVEELRCFERAASIGNLDFGNNFSVQRGHARSTTANVLVRCQSYEHVSAVASSLRIVNPLSALQGPLRPLHFGMSEETVTRMSVEDVSILRGADSIVDVFSDYEQYELPEITSPRVEICPLPEVQPYSEELLDQISPPATQADDFEFESEYAEEQYYFRRRMLDAIAEISVDSRDSNASHSTLAYVDAASNLTNSQSTLLSYETAVSQFSSFESQVTVADVDKTSSQSMDEESSQIAAMHPELENAAPSSQLETTQHVSETRESSSKDVDSSCVTEQNIEINVVAVESDAVDNAIPEGMVSTSVAPSPDLLGADVDSTSSQNKSLDSAVGADQVSISVSLTDSLVEEPLPPVAELSDTQTEAVETSAKASEITETSDVNLSQAVETATTAEQSFTIIKPEEITSAVDDAPLHVVEQISESNILPASGSLVSEDVKSSVIESETTEEQSWAVISTDEISSSIPASISKQATESNIVSASDSSTVERSATVSETESSTSFIGKKLSSEKKISPKSSSLKTSAQKPSEPEDAFADIRKALKPTGLKKAAEQKEESQKVSLSEKSSKTVSFSEVKTEFHLKSTTPLPHLEREKTLTAGSAEGNLASSQEVVVMTSLKDESSDAKSSSVERVPLSASVKKSIGGLISSGSSSSSSPRTAELIRQSAIEMHEPSLHRENAVLEESSAVSHDSAVASNVKAPENIPINVEQVVSEDSVKQNSVSVQNFQPKVQTTQKTISSAASIDTNMTLENPNILPSAEEPVQNQSFTSTIKIVERNQVHQTRQLQHAREDRLSSSFNAPQTTGEVASLEQSCSSVEGRVVDQSSLEKAVIAENIPALFCAASRKLKRDEAIEQTVDSIVLPEKETSPHKEEIVKEVLLQQAVTSVQPNIQFFEQPIRLSATEEPPKMIIPVIVETQPTFVQDSLQVGESLQQTPSLDNVPSVDENVFDSVDKTDQIEQNPRKVTFNSEVEVRQRSSDHSESCTPPVTPKPSSSSAPFSEPVPLHVDEEKVAPVPPVSIEEVSSGLSPSSPDVSNAERSPNQPLIAPTPVAPLSPKGIRVTDVDSGRATLAWEKPAASDNAPIHGFVLEARDKTSGKWVKLKELPADADSCTIEGLENGKEYEFRIMAKNDQGLSDPSEATPLTLIKGKKVPARIKDKNLIMGTRMKSNQSFTVTANFSGEPEPSVRWTVDGKDVPVDDTLTIVNAPFKTTLDIKVSKRKQTGVYCVIVQNDSGTDKHEIEIVVLASPSKPGGPLKVSDVTKDGCKLQWQAPDDLGGCEFLGYKVEKFDPEKGVWETVKEGIQKPEFDVKNLQEGHKYQFRVTAQNTQGASEALETSSPTLAKNPFDPPGKPGKPTVVDSSPSFIEVQWQPPASDGGAKIIGYHVERADPKTGRFVRISNEPVPDLHFRDDRVTAGRGYKYRVVAVNAGGDSEPSESSDDLIAKNLKEAPKIDLSFLPLGGEIRVKAGDPLALAIPVSGEPPPTITWSKDGFPTPSSLTAEQKEGEAKLSTPSANRAQHNGTYTITATNASGTTTAEVRVVVLDKPDAPEGPIEASNVTADACHLKWQPPKQDGGSEITGYVVEKREVGTNAWSKCATMVTGPECNVRGLEEGKKYEFRVMAENLIGLSEPLVGSHPVLAKNPFDPPGPPQNVQVAAVDAVSATLKWEPPKNDGGRPVKGYVIEKKSSRSPTWTRAVQYTIGGNEFTVTGLTEGDEVQFRVAAVNEAGPGEYSHTTPSVEIKDPIVLASPPGQPQVDKITKNTVQLSWTKPLSEGNSKLVEYVVEAQDEGAGPDDWQEVAKVPAKETSATVKNLKEGAKKKFRIRAVNAGGPGEPSRPTAVLTVEDQPERPSFGIGQLAPITVKAGQPFTLTVPFVGHPLPDAVWKVNGNDLKADAGHVIKVEPGTATLHVPKAKRSDNGDYLLTLTNNMGTGSISGVVKVLAPPGTPGGPIEVESTDGETMQIAWKPPADDGGEPITHYQVEKRIAGTQKWTKVPGTSAKPEATVKNLETGQKYEFRVVACNDQGESEPLETSQPLLAKSPFDPPGQTGTPECETTTPDSITLKWEPPSKDGGAPIRGYIVEKRLKGDKKWTKACETADDKVTVRGLSEGKEYEFRVTAVNTAGLSGEPSDTSAAIKAQPPPVAPRVQTALLPRDIRVKAGEAFKIAIPYSGYPPPTAKWAHEGVPLTLGDRRSCEVAPNTVTLHNSCAQRGDTGRYTLTLQNPTGQDQVSINVIVLDVPGAPEHFEVKEVSDTTVTLAWQPPKDNGGCPVSNYVVEKCDVRLSAGTDRQVWEKVTRFARTTDCVVEGLSVGHDYQFRVCAENEVGVGKPADLDRPVKTIKAIHPPGSPTGLAVFDIDKDQATLRWNSPTNDGGDKNLSYVVEVLDRRTGEWKPLNNGNPIKGNEFTATKLPENGDVEFRVRAKNESGLGKPSESTGVVRLKSKYNKASAPGSPELTKRETFPKLEWTRPLSDGGSKITGYVVEFKTPNDSAWIPLTSQPAPNPNLQLTPELGRLIALSGSPTTQFRVAAVTQNAGVGEYSLPTASFNVKDLLVAAPTVEEGLVDQTGKYGADVRFSVKANGSGPMNVKWYVGDCEVVHGGRFRIYRNDVDGQFTLTIAGLEEADAGQVRVQVSNSLGQDSSSAQLKIARAPKFETNLTEANVVAGETAKMKVPFVGTEPITFVLKRNGKPVEGDRFRVTYMDKYATIVMKDCLADDTGSYTLEAENPAGIDTMAVKLTVQSPPGAPTGPLRVSDISKNTCTVSWRAPSSDGGSKITHYVVEKRDISKPYWTTVSSVVKDLNVFTQGLTENCQYCFRVAAVNNVGQSEWLTLTTPITARLPFDKPGPPQSISVTEVGGDFVNLSWDRPLSDGGGRLLGYAVERREVDSNGSWIRMTPADKLCISTMLNVPNLIEDHKYEFRVFAVNEAGESQPLETARPVLVRDPNAASVPVFTVPLKKVTGVEGGRAEFHCKIECSQHPEVTWFKGTRELGSSTAKYDMTHDSDGNYRLCIRDCQLDDEDEFMVRARTSAGARQSRADLTIHAAPRIRLPSNFSTTITLSVGEELDLRIPFTANPRPTVRWTANGHDVQGSDRVVMALAARHALLTVRRLTRADSGSYKITVSNDMGDDNVVLTLNVIDRPSPPVGLTVKSVTDEAVVLDWAAPSNDGGSPIISYIVEKREEGMDSWIRCALSRSTTVSLGSLLENKSYQFRVIAENACARSEPCEASRGVMVLPSKPRKRLPEGMDEDFWKRSRSKKQENVSDYDAFVQDLHAKHKARPATIQSSRSVYDSYDILEELGRGAFGVVYRCRERATGDIYAVKFLHCPNNEDKAVVRQEVNIMNHLIHSRLLHCHEAFESDDEMAVVLEFMSGGELLDRISSQSRFTEEEVIGYIRQVCYGIKHMHDQGIVHLDIKPENVLFETKTGHGVKLVDFGLATKLNPDEPVKVSLATLDFAAPEIVQYDPVGFYTDMWSIGVLSYVLLSGISPFAGSSEAETSQNISKGRWQFNDSAFSSISKEARDFISSLIVVDGSKRMNIYEALDHPWLQGHVKSSSSLSADNHRELLKRLREKRADFERSILALGRLAGSGYSSLRRNRLKEFNMYESRFDRREMAPRFVRKPLPVVVAEGQAAILTCVIVALSPPIVTWFAGGAKQLTQSVKHLQLSSSDTYTLKISRCELDDGGEYLVRAENSFGSKEYSTSVTVVAAKVDDRPKRDSYARVRREMKLEPIDMEEEDSRPIVTFHLRDRLIQQGDYCKLLCCITGRPKPQILWQKDGKPLDTSVATQGWSNGVASLEFVSCKPEDSGRYTCRAVNSLGETETTCLVRVEANPVGLRRPSITSSMVRRVDMRERSCEPAMLISRSDRHTTPFSTRVTTSMYTSSTTSYTPHRASSRVASPSPIVIAGAYIHHPSLSHAGSWSSLTNIGSSSTTSTSRTTSHFTSGSNFNI